MKSLLELINTTEPGFTIVKDWISNAPCDVDVLPRDILRAERELHALQVTTRSPMGAIVYETGGILVKNGWIRILGSGNERLNRGIMEWNLGKTYTAIGDPMPFLLIADDVVGGFFAINSGGLDSDGIGKVFYFAQDTLKWESTNLSYSEFLVFCFSERTAKFYETMFWNGWENDLKNIRGDQCFSFYPFLWTKEGKDINNVSRKIVAVQEIWGLSQDMKRQLASA
jgi:hypothetical protein